jgi:TRAP-type C4-dicarboxylate transport system permease small subunit
MSAAQNLVPPQGRRWLNASGYLGAAGFCGLMTYLGFVYIVSPTESDETYLTEILPEWMRGLFGGVRYVFGTQGMIGSEATLEGTEIPAWFGILSAPVGFGIATVRFVAAAVSAALGGSYGDSAAEEGMEEAQQAASGAEEATAEDGQGQEGEKERAAKEEEE